MNKDSDRLNRSPKPAALKRLTDHLAALDAGNSSNLPRENDMLSLILSGTLGGQDISKRYPSFYQKLLANADLRQAFLDALESVEAERAGQLIPVPETGQASLAFLKKQLAVPVVEVLGKEGWRATWQRTLKQIQSIFSPPELAYRLDPSLSEDSWFTLLRDEITAAGTVYAVALDCTLSSNIEDALAIFLSIAVTLGASSEPLQFPLRASLEWGTYQESALIPKEGRVRFPDIPLSAISDPEQRQIQAGLRLTLETPP